MGRAKRWKPNRLAGKLTAFRTGRGLSQKRWKPKRLAGKLVAVRTGRGLSQSQMVGALGLKNKITREDISTFERGLREPPLPILLKYARLAGVSTDVLIDDKLDLAAVLP